MEPEYQMQFSVILRILRGMSYLPTKMQLVCSTLPANSTIEGIKYYFI